MRIIIDILHPAHVHFFRNFIKEMQKRGHKILVTARKKDIALDLLKLYKIKHITLSEKRRGFFGLFLELIKRDYKFYKIAREFKPDIIMGIMGATIATTGIFLKAKSIVFWDTEHCKLINRIIYFLSDVVCTPSCYQSKIKKIHGRHINYPGYHELAYLHPNRFKPNPAILKKLNLSKKDNFFLIRFVSWEAVHDTKGEGFINKLEFIKKLEKYGKVFITYEGKLPQELKKYSINIPFNKIHDLLYYATMYIGEGATMASETAVLGTPSIYVNNLKVGYIKELDKRYGLVFDFSNQKDAIKKALRLLEIKNLKKKWRKRKDIMLKDKIDVTAWMVKFIENYYNGNFKK